jgi:hypothetical protein
MSGFGFIEYEDPLDARDIVPSKMVYFPSNLTCANLISLP